MVFFKAALADLTRRKILDELVEEDVNNTFNATTVGERLVAG
jgi:hypothetical protein